MKTYEQLLSINKIYKKTIYSFRINALIIYHKYYILRQKLS